MTIYRIYYTIERYVLSDVYEDGYRDDYYSEWDCEEVAVKYVDSVEKAIDIVNKSKGEKYEYCYEKIEVE